MTRLPVSIVTGFLGSGKTTLIRSLLRDPRFSRAAIIVNEFGEVGLDHDLIESSDEQLVQLSTGCLCCAVRSDVVMTLLDLVRRRRSGELPPFERVIIETSGLADPAPILHALMTDAGVFESCELMPLITLVDAQNGQASISAHALSRQQVAVADWLVLTKTDLNPRTEALRQDLASLNPLAAVVVSRKGNAPYERIFGAAESSRRIASEAGSGEPPMHDHPEGIVTTCLVRDEPVPAAALSLFLQALVEHAGSKLLRVKGLVRLAEAPEQPAVVHGVQHVFEPLSWLERWPRNDHQTRIVFIGLDLRPGWPGRLLRAIEGELPSDGSEAPIGRA